MTEITQKGSVAAFPLWSHLKTELLGKKSGNNFKDIIGISIAYCLADLRWGTWNKIKKIKFSVKVDF